MHFGATFAAWLSSFQRFAAAVGRADLLLARPRVPLVARFTYGAPDDDVTGVLASSDEPPPFQEP